MNFFISESINRLEKNVTTATTPFDNYLDLFFRNFDKKKVKKRS